MSVSLKSEETIRAYLLSRVSDETTLEGIEELLFSDEEFCSQVELAEEDLINNYVMGLLNAADAESFRATLTANAERRLKVELTEALKEKATARDSMTVAKPSSFFTTFAVFLRQPQYAALAVILIAAVGLVIYLSRQSSRDDIAELRSIYRQARPTESRISEFGYAPLPQLRGSLETGEQNQLRRIENNLIDATEKDSNARSHHALGVFRLTQQKYSDAIQELELALKFANQDAQIHNDLGVAHFELAKTVGKDKNLAELEHSLEAFTKATELDGNLLEALFNKSLALQELDLLREAKESWQLYLQRDPSSPWAEEARKNLARLESRQTSLGKSSDQVLSDFLTAYRNRDDARAYRIHNETKGTLDRVTIPLQLAHRYMNATKQGNQAEGKESLEALLYIGDFDREQNGDAFFGELAKFYARAGSEKLEGLLQAQKFFATGYQPAATNGTEAISQFEKSRDLFARLGNECEAAVAENWAVQFLPDNARVVESRARLASTIANAESKRFLVLLAPAYYWLGISDYRQGRFSESARNLKTALRFAEATNNTFEIQHAQHALAVNYFELGEFGPALLYAGELLNAGELYYQNQNQEWRNKGVLADLALRLKFFSTALSLARERLAMAQELWPTTSRVNDSFRLMIEAATFREDFPAALGFASESMQIAINGSDTPDNARKLAEIYRLQADVRRQSKNCNEALVDYDKALDLYRRFPEVSETLYQIHRGKLFCFQQLNWQNDFANELEIVFKLSEMYRATIREDDSRQAFFASEQGVVDVAAANLLGQQDSRGAFAVIEASRARSLLDFVESGKSIAEVEKSFGPVARPLSLAEIQKRLPEQVQVVQYAVLPEKVAIWVVSRTRFDLIEKQITAAELEDKIEAYQVLILHRDSPAKIKQAAQDLYSLLIPPDLATVKQICFIPDKSLHQLAFATLVSPEGNYLLQTYTPFYSPSVSVLVLASENAQRRENREENLLSIGNPDFDSEENVNLPDLKDAEIEARTITADYPKSLELVGSEATKEKFLRNIEKVEVIHFAGHFLSNRQSPGNSKLLFAGGEVRTSELGAYKLLPAKLVVLSACETGFEFYNKSEGAIGIARTWLALGAPVVVASQWKVDSEPTKDLMIAFHRNRKEKRMSSAESLRQAQLELLSREATKAPAYWAAFSLFGGYANY